MTNEPLPDDVNIRHTHHWTWGTFKIETAMGAVVDIPQGLGCECGKWMSCDEVQDIVNTRSGVTEADARSIIEHISNAAIDLAFTRHDLTSEEYDEDNYPEMDKARALTAFIEEIQTDTVNALTGDDSGCLDEDELDETNCELLWLKAQLNNRPVSPLSEAERAVVDTAIADRVARKAWIEAQEAYGAHPCRDDEARAWEAHRIPRDRHDQAVDALLQERTAQEGETEV